MRSVQMIVMIRTTLYMIALCWLSWLGMQILHELGHVLGAMVTGGQVVFVELHPARISRTDVHPNPAPLFVVWAGPIVGTLGPTLLWFLLSSVKSRLQNVSQFFAGFCLIANGAYLGSVFVEPVGDAADLLRHGAPTWTLAAFAVSCCLSGLFLWDQLSSRRRQSSASPLPPSMLQTLILWGLLMGMLTALSIRSFFTDVPG